MHRLAQPFPIAIAFFCCVLVFSTLRYVIGMGVALASMIPLAVLGFLALGLAVYGLAKHRTASSAGAVLVVACAWAAWVLVPLDTVAVHAKFWLERLSYDAAVADLKVGRQPACVLARTCLHEPGSWVPLAFPWEGIIDNWVGVVYDPTGAVVDADRFRGIFGGDLVGCWRVSGTYFFCSFT